LAKGNIKTGLVGGDEAVEWAIEEYKRQKIPIFPEDEMWD